MVVQYEYGFDLHLNQSVYLSAEPPPAIPGAFQPTGQLPNPVDSQYPSPQHLHSGSGWRHQTFNPLQPPLQGIRACIQLVRSQLRGKFNVMIVY